MINSQKDLLKEMVKKQLKVIEAGKRLKEVKEGEEATPEESEKE